MVSAPRCGSLGSPDRAGKADAERRVESELALSNEVDHARARDPFREVRDETALLAAHPP
jgi:hypothetical protein